MPPQIGDSEKDPKVTIMDQELSSEKIRPISLRQQFRLPSKFPQQQLKSPSLKASGG
jgi:hypothetical protein